MSDSIILLVKHITIVRGFKFDTPCIFSRAIYHALQWICELFISRFSSWEMFSQEVQDLLFEFAKL